MNASHLIKGPGSPLGSEGYEPAAATRVNYWTLTWASVLLASSFGGMLLATPLTAFAAALGFAASMVGFASAVTTGRLSKKLGSAADFVSPTNLVVLVEDAVSGRRSSFEALANRTEMIDGILAIRNLSGDFTEIGRNASRWTHVWVRTTDLVGTVDAVTRVTGVSGDLARRLDATPERGPLQEPGGPLDPFPERGQLRGPGDPPANNGQQGSSGSDRGGDRSGCGVNCSRTTIPRFSE